METLTLKRQGFAHGTFSTLFDEHGVELCKMVECPWQNNTPFVSCIPIGTYELLPHSSPKHGKCYALECETLGVTRYGPSIRTHCLMHIATRASQLQGCMSPGVKFGVEGNEWAVLESEKAFNKLLTYLDGKPALLEIVNA